MQLREEFSRPRNVGLALAVGAAALFANCDDRKPEVQVAPVVKVAPKVSPKIHENTDEVLEGFRRVFQEEESDEPRVTFGPDAAGDLYATEKGLADCIQSEENTCYLSPDFTSRFHTNVRCFSNAWVEDSLEISFVGSAPDGMSTVVRLPDGERMEYERPPHPGIDPVAAGDFYTDICRDVLELLKEIPPVNPCIESPDSFECFNREHSTDWAFDFAPAFKDTFALLSENDFDVRDGGTNFLNIGFESLDGTRQSQFFFPQPAYCFEEYDMIPCWKFERQFGGVYTTDELLEKSFEMQETLDEGGKL